MRVNILKHGLKITRLHGTETIHGIIVSEKNKFGTQIKRIKGLRRNGRIRGIITSVQIRDSDNQPSKSEH